MRNYDSNDEYDAKEAKAIGAKPWQLDLLKLNPEYTCWGPGEDYMDSGESGRERGWQSSILLDRFEDRWALDELNELVHFYFSVERAAEPCEECDQTGYNRATKQLADDWYDFAKTGERWCDRITQDEVDALVAHGRLYDLTHTFVPGTGWVQKDPPHAPTAEEVNVWSPQAFLGGHDAINRGICIETRAKRYGVWGYCPKCEGRGEYFTEPEAHVELTLWFLHPRKGAARGVRIKRIEQSEIPGVRRYLRAAALRNAERFAKVTEVV